MVLNHLSLQIRTLIHTDMLWILAENAKMTTVIVADMTTVIVAEYDRLNCAIPLWLWGWAHEDNFDAIPLINWCLCGWVSVWCNPTDELMFVRLSICNIHVMYILIPWKYRWCKTQLTVANERGSLTCGPPHVNQSMRMLTDRTSRLRHCHNDIVSYCFGLITQSVRESLDMCTYLSYSRWYL